MSNLWERMGYIYGHKFTSVYGEVAYDGSELTEAAKTWAAGLAGLAGDDIAKGLRECIACGDSWPPALPDFVRMCNGKKDNGFGLDYIPEYHREVNRVSPENRISSDERDEHRKEVSKKGMADIRLAMKK